MSGTNLAPTYIDCINKWITVNSYCLQDYLTEIDLKGYESLHQFWRQLDTKYPRPQVKALEQAYSRLEEGDEAGFYETIFQDYDIAFAFAGLRISLYKSVCDWITKSLEPNSTNSPNQILDAGCGNGILTCYLAKLFPEAQVLGIDLSEDAIKHAQTLAEKLSLKNIRFEKGDIKDFSIDTTTDTASNSSPEFDLILSVAALDVSSPFLIKQLHNLCKYLAPDGLLLNFEKLSNAQMQIHFMQSLENASLYPVLEKCNWLSYECAEGDIIHLPAFASSKNDKSPKLTSEQSRSFLLPKSNLLSGLDLSFKQEALSELLFSQLNPKKMIQGYQADFHDGSGSYWFELWQSGPFALLYEHTDQGYRNLRILPLYLIDEFHQVLKEWLEQTAKHAELDKLID